MNEKIFNSLAAAYILIWIITFGHAVNRPVDCSKPYIRDDVHRQWSESMCRDRQSITKLLITVFWPFYWSAQAFEGDA